MKPTSKIPRKSPLPAAPARSHKRRDAREMDSAASVSLVCSYGPCGRHFTGRVGKKYCCIDHQQKAHQRRRRSPHPQRKCAWPKCGVSFTPTRSDKKYHSESCRKAASFERHFRKLPEAEFQPGDVVRDLNGRTRTVVEVVYSVAYFLNGEPEQLYQPDEVSKP